MKRKKKKKGANLSLGELNELHLNGLHKFDLLRHYALDLVNGMEKNGDGLSWLPHPGEPVHEGGEVRHKGFVVICQGVNALLVLQDQLDSFGRLKCTHQVSRAVKKQSHSLDGGVSFHPPK